MADKELEKIYGEAYRAVYWTSMSLLKNEADAEDIVQDTFVTLIESYDTIRDKTKVIPWLKKAAANKCLNRLTRTKTVAVEDEFFEDVEATPEDFLPDSILESEEARKIIMDIIDRSLSEDIRRTLILFYFDEMSTREIAEALDVPEGTVRRRLNFARNKIKKEVEKYEEEDKTKLFVMPLPFLSRLFIKESEQVPFKAMPANLLSLSASSKASNAGAAAKTAASAAKKGTGMIMKKVIIGSVVSLVAIGVIVGVIVTNANKSGKPGQAAENRTRSEEREDREDREEREDRDTREETEETGSATEATEPSMELTEDSIVIHMDDMTAEQIVENVWNTANISVGMTQEDYEARFYIPEDMTLAGQPFNTENDSWYWQFYGLSSDVRISTMYVLVSIDENGVVDYTEEGAGASPTINFDDPELCAEVFELFIAKYESLGYTVIDDYSYQGSRMVEFDNGTESPSITFNSSTIVLFIPLSASGS